MSKYKVRLTLSIGYCNADRTEIIDLCDDCGEDETRLDALSSEDLEKFLRDYWKEWAGNYIDGGSEVIA